MIAVLQRTSNASVSVKDKIIGQIQDGVVVLLGVKRGDSYKESEYLAQKVSKLRIFNDKKDKMNLSLVDISGSVLVISQFTLCADTRKGRRPSFVNSAKSEFAEEIYNKFIEKIKEENLLIQTGIFGAKMQVNIINEGPVTLILSSD